MLVDLEKGKLVPNDEAFKMALTDAISVACKAIGVAADVYWEGDTTKYDRASSTDPEPLICERCQKPITGIKTKKKKYTAPEIANNAKKTYGLQLCWDCMAATKKLASAAGVAVNAYDPGKSGF